MTTFPRRAAETSVLNFLPQMRRQATWETECQLSKACPRLFLDPVSPDGHRLAMKGPNHDCIGLPYCCCFFTVKEYFLIWSLTSSSCSHSSGYPIMPASLPAPQSQPAPSWGPYACSVLSVVFRYSWQSNILTEASSACSLPAPERESHPCCFTSSVLVSSLISEPLNHHPSAFMFTFFHSYLNSRPTKDGDLESSYSLVYFRGLKSGTQSVCHKRVQGMEDCAFPHSVVKGKWNATSKTC